MKKVRPLMWLCILSFLAGAGLAHGAVYYVSGSGDDSFDGLSADTAWRSIEKVNGTGVSPGDSVLFRRGDVWRGQLRPCSGEESASVYYGAFGEGDKPLLLGSVDLSSPEAWTLDPDGIWTSSPPSPQGGDVFSGAGFSEEMRGWHGYFENGAAGRLAPSTGPAGIENAAISIECKKAGAKGSDIQFYTSAFALQSGGVYQFRFMAKAGASCSLAPPCLMQSGAPWKPYASWPGQVALRLDTEWRAYTLFYYSFMSAEDARLTFFLGASLGDGGDLCIADASLRQCTANLVLRNDVGNIILDGEKQCAVKVWERADLNEQGEFWYDEERHTVSMFSADNPGRFYAHIECAIREHLVDQGGGHHIVYEGLAFKYGAAHGIGGGSTHHIAVRDCDFGYIGGGDQSGGDKTVRYGNGVEFWGTAHDHVVEGCRLWEIYDAALTNQSSGPRTPQYNIVYRNNLIWNSEYSFEYWNRPEESETYNIVFENNVCLNAGGGWGHAQRPDPSGRHLCFYTSPAALREVHIRGNIFFKATKNAFYAPQWTRASVDALDMDANVWYQPDGVMMAVAGTEFSMAQFDAYRAAFNKEPNSRAGIPEVAGWGEPSFRLGGVAPELGVAAVFARLQ